MMNAEEYREYLKKAEEELEEQKIRDLQSERRCREITRITIVSTVFSLIALAVSVARLLGAI